MCLFPMFIHNPKYKPNKKNKYNPPQLKDERIKYVPTGCGKCIECLKQKAREWQVRLQEEIKTDKTGLFITFSYSDKWLNQLENQCQWTDEIIGIRKSITLPNGSTRNYYNKVATKLDNPPSGYDLDNAVATLSVRLFLERWRKNTGKSVKHWFVTELGTKSTERLHLHGILFTDKTKDEISKIWKYGNIFIGDYVNVKTINYIVKYLHKTDQTHKYYTPKILCSAGLGSNYINTYNATLNKYNGKNTKDTYRTNQGHLLALPIYYRNQIYTEEEREKLWLHKLDEEIRWINGIKIDVSTEKGMQLYENILLQEQEKNKRLGYGNREINHSRIRS